MTDNILSGRAATTCAITAAPVLLDSSENRATNMSVLEIVEPHQQRTKLKLAAVLAGLNLAVFISALDQSVIAPAIASIVAEFHAAAGYQWVASAYLLANAAAAPIWASLSDIWGRKLAILSSVTMFFFSSIICARATSLAMLIAGRALQGIAGGGVLQLVIVCLSDLFSVRRRGLVLGLTEVMWCLAGGIGPLIGGALAEKISWRWIFWINLPVCGITFILIFFFLDVHNPRTRFIDGFKAIDWFGSLSIVGLTIMLLLGLDFGGTIAPWSSPKVICLIVFGAFMSILFVYSEKRLAKYPLMPLSMFKQRSNVAAFAVNFGHAFVFIAAEYYIPLYLQSAKAKSPLHAGLLTLPLLIGEGVMGIIAGVYMHSVGRYQEPIWLGTILLTIGTGLYISLGVDSSVESIIAFGAIGGGGAGLLFAPPLIALQARVSQADTATASAAFGFVRSVSAAISVVVGGVVFQNGMEKQTSELLRNGVLSAELAEQFSGHEATASVLLIPTIQNQVQRRLIQEAYSWSLRNMWIMYTSVAGVSVVAGLFVARSVLSEIHTETKTGLGSRDAVGTLTEERGSGRARTGDI